MDTDKRIKAEGLPFELEISVTGLGAIQEFVLDDDTYDGEEGYFENKMLWVSAFKVVPEAIKLVPEATAQIEALRFDDVLVWAGTGAGIGIDLCGAYDDVTGIVMPSVFNKFGAIWMPARNKVSLKHTDDTGLDVTSTVKLWGLYTERTM